MIDFRVIYLYKEVYMDNKEYEKIENKIRNVFDAHEKFCID